MAAVDVKCNTSLLSYIWGTFLCLLVSVVCFVMSATLPTLLYPAVASGILSVVCLSTYVAQYCIKQRTPCCVACRCCTCFCRCCAVILCLSKEDAAFYAHAHDDTEVLDETTDTENSHYDVTIVNVNDHHETSEETQHSQLRSLEHEIKRLRHQHDCLERQECVDSIVQHDHENLNREEARVASWIENQTTPTNLEIKAMKTRLKMAARNFRLARTRMQNTGTSTNGNRSSVIQVDMDAPEQVRIFDQEVPVPPEYSRLDPSPNATRLYAQTVKVRGIPGRPIMVHEQNGVTSPSVAVPVYERIPATHITMRLKTVCNQRNGHMQHQNAIPTSDPCTTTKSRHLNAIPTCEHNPTAEHPHAIPACDDYPTAAPAYTTAAQHVTEGYENLAFSAEPPSDETGAPPCYDNCVGYD